MKTLFYALLIPFLVVITSCKTEIPETDTTAPTFAFKISGDGFDHTFTQDDDFDTFLLKLKADVTYDFVLSAGDNGGLKQVQWELADPSYFQITSEINSPWTIRNISTLSRMIEWNGSVSNPVTGTILGGKFIPKKINNSNTASSFRFYFKDFGGNSGNSNTIFAELNLSVGNFNDAEILNL